MKNSTNFHLQCRILTPTEVGFQVKLSVLTSKLTIDKYQETTCSIYETKERLTESFIKQQQLYCTFPACTNFCSHRKHNVVRFHGNRSGMLYQPLCDEGVEIVGAHCIVLSPENRPTSTQ